METKVTTLAEALADKLAPESGTREKIEYIDIDDVQPDPRNFYELSDIDELAANIELFGLQQPLRVRDDPMDPDKVILVSGHRRRAAIEKLVADGREDLREIACIREREAGSEALQELRLIFANSDTRRMTSAEISRQAERVEALLYQLKEEGYDFPGRMRDHVAEACKVSKSKLARLKVIREGLIPTLCMAWEEGELNEEQAYTLAQMDSEMQGFIEGYAYQDKKSWYAWRLQGWAEGIQRIRALECSRTEGRPPCQWQHERIANFIIEAAVPYQCGATCCADCWQLPDCQDACRKCEDAAREKREAREAQEATRKTREAQREADLAEEREAETAALRRQWARIGALWRRSGADERQVWMVLNAQDDPDEDDLDDFVALANGPQEDITYNSPEPILPYSLSIEDLENLVAIADFFDCTLDYLLGRTETPAAVEAPKVWQTGRPPRSGRYYARFSDEAGPMEMPCEYSVSRDEWSIIGGMKIEAACTGWWWLPEED